MFCLGDINGCCLSMVVLVSNIGSIPLSSLLHYSPPPKGGKARDASLLTLPYRLLGRGAPIGKGELIAGLQGVNLGTEIF